MFYSIFMLKPGHKNTFMNYEWASAHGGVKFDDYETVYTGEIQPGDTPASTLETIYRLFNMDHPSGYKGRSLSVSDLVAIEDTGTYFCDSIGWKQIN